MILRPPSWECPSCGLEHVGHPDGGALFHNCPALGGVSLPLQLKGVRARHVVHEPDDFVGSTRTQMHEGRPVVAVSTERQDGTNDLTVLAPAATVRSHIN